MEKYYMRFLAVIVGQACNLRCLDCGNLTPFAPHETKRYNVDHIIESLETLIYGGGGGENSSVTNSGWRAFPASCT